MLSTGGIYILHVNCPKEISTPFDYLYLKPIDEQCEAILQYEGVMLNHFEFGPRSILILNISCIGDDVTTYDLLLKKQPLEDLKKQWTNVIVYYSRHKFYTNHPDK